MDKAIVVIDMPKICGECPMCIDDEYDLTHECCLKYKGYVDKKHRPTWCPLKIIPEKYDTDKPYILDFNEDYERGYNACVDEILEQS